MNSSTIGINADHAAPSSRKLPGSGKSRVKNTRQNLYTSTSKMSNF